MARTIKIKCRINEQRLVPYNIHDWKTALKIYNDQDVMVAIGKQVKQRSNPQNDYLWGGPYKTISDFTGQDIESIHEFFKDLFLKVWEDGKVIPAVRSTSSLTTVEFIEYYRKIIQWAAEFLVDDNGVGLYIAEPNEEEMWHSLEQSEAQNAR